MMRHLILAAALTLLAAASPALAAPVSLGGWTAAAGKPEQFHLNRTDTSAAQTFTFATRDGTAKAGADYTTVNTTVTLAAGEATVAIPVPTIANPASYGTTLHFSAAVSVNGVVAATAGSSIAEPSLPQFGGKPSIASDFDPALGMKDIAVNTLDNGVDPVGAFRFICGGGGVNYDDPLVFPGQPGKSHLHQYYGVTANAFTTYESLRKASDSEITSTCSGDPKLGGHHVLNRSAYWMPAILVGNKWVLQPNDVSIYYKRLPLSDPGCQPITVPGGKGKCVPIPNGLGMIAGYDMVTNTAPTGHHKIMCVTAGGAVVSQPGDSFLAVASCPAGDDIDVRLSMPDCWDGVNLDSANHRSHVAYMVLHNGVYSCPADHPDQMPVFTIAVIYPVTPEVASALAELKAEADAAEPWDYTKVLHFSSDEMRPSLTPGQTEHADFLEAHDPFEKFMWDVDPSGCIEHHLNCSGGDMGNGHRILGAGIPYYNGVARWTNPVPLLPIPPKPAPSSTPM